MHNKRLSCTEQGVWNRESLCPLLLWYPMLQILPASSALLDKAPCDSQPHTGCSQLPPTPEGLRKGSGHPAEAWLGWLWTLLVPCESWPRCQGSCWWHRRRFVPAPRGYYGNWGEGEQTDGAESQPAWGDFRASCGGLAGNCLRGGAVCGAESSLSFGAGPGCETLSTGLNPSPECPQQLPNLQKDSRDPSF